jgi:small subunit ribosomal protein S17
MEENFETGASEVLSETAETATSASRAAGRRRQEKVGLVTSDKMQKTVVVRVERQVRHPKYRRYIRRRTKFMAHDELGAHTGDIVRIIETRPLSARKRWRVVEIVQRAS